MAGNAPEQVKYIGLFAERQIRDHEWSGAGVKGMQTTVWNNRNRWTLPGDQFTKEALKVLEEDGSFAILRREEEEHDPEEAPTHA